VAEHDFVLTPGRYVGAADAEADDEPIDEKIARLQAELFAEFEEGQRLEQVIQRRLGVLHD
jgi:type I restriction enzyme M protein